MSDQFDWNPVRRFVLPPTQVRVVYIRIHRVYIRIHSVYIRIYRVRVVYNLKP